MAEKKKVKVSTVLFVIVFVSICLLGIVLIFPVFTNYQNMGRRLDELEIELAQKNAECIRLSRLVHNLKYDSGAVEKVAREKFGLCKKGELIYKYSETPTTDSGGLR